MPNGPIEIISSRERRRRWSMEEKLRIVAETHEPGATIRAVAVRHDIYPSLLRNWRRQVRDGYLAASPPARFMPLRVTESPTTTAAPPPVIAERAAADRIEVMFPDGTRLQVGGDVNLAALRRVVTVLRG
jgi:transposase